MAKTIYIPYNLTEHHCERGLSRHLAYYTLWKHIHRNSRIYPKSLRKLADKFNCSVTTVKKYMAWFLSNGYAKQMPNGVIQFIKKSELCTLLGFDNSGKRAEFVFDSSRPGKKLFYEIESLLIKKNINQQQYIIELKQKVINTLLQAGKKYSKNEKRAIKRFIRDYAGKLSNITPDNILDVFNLNEKTVISNKTIGNLVSKSERTGKRRQKLWNESGIIKSVVNYVQVQKMTLDQFLLKRQQGYTQNNSFYKDGCECIRLANEVLWIRSVRFV